MELVFLASLFVVVYGNRPIPQPGQVQVVQVQEVVEQSATPIPTRRPFPTVRPITFPALPTLPTIPPVVFPTLAPIPIVPPLIPQFFYVISDGLSKIGGALGRPGGLIPLVNVNASPNGVSVTSSVKRRRRKV